MAVVVTATTRKVAAITGAGRGIGSSIAVALAEAEYDLAIGWRSDEAAAEQTAKRAEAAGATVVLVQGDVADPGASTALVEASVEVLGGLDLWVNNAGISVLAPLLETTPSEAERLISVNYLGTFYGVTTAGRAMAGSGVAASSTSPSDLGVQAAPLLAAYSASKFAVVGLTHRRPRSSSPPSASR